MNVTAPISSAPYISPVQLAEHTELRDFLASVFGADYSKLAGSYIDCMFSNDFRKPTFLVMRHAASGIIGCAAYTEELFTVGVWGISWVAVNQAHRNKGFGAQLLNACLSGIAAKSDQNPVTVILATYPEQTRLYEKLGFVNSGQDAQGGAFMTKVLAK